MGVQSNGCITIPALYKDRDSYYAVRMTAGLSSDLASNSCVCRIDAKDLNLYESVFEVYPGMPQGWRQTSFLIPSSLASDGQITLAFHVDSFAVTSKPPWSSQIMLKELASKRFLFVNDFRINIGSSGDEWFLIDGFHMPEKTRNGVPFRWTKEQAIITIPLRTAIPGQTIRITYLLEGRPSFIADPDPLFSWNGTILDSKTSIITNDGIRYAAATISLRPEHQTRTANILEIKSPVWIPSETGFAQDPRRLGIMLHSVETLK